MAKGAIAKQNVINIIQQAFGEDYIGVVDKKVYVWAEEDGAKVQIALSLTCPKVQVDAPAPAGSNVTADGWDFDSTPITEPSPHQKAEVTAEEQANIAEMMKRLGL